MKAAVAAMTVFVLSCAAACGSSMRALRQQSRFLAASEIANVLRRSCEAIAGRTFQLSSGPGTQGIDVRMGTAGQPRAVRHVWMVQGGTVTVNADHSTWSTKTMSQGEMTTLIDYPGLKGRGCRGGAARGELVIEYRRQGAVGGWTAAARYRTPQDVGGAGLVPLFEMLQGRGSIASGAHQRVAERPALALVAPYTPVVDARSSPAILVGDPTPNLVGEPSANSDRSQASQTLWVDIESLRPLRWEVSDRGEVTYGYDFNYKLIDLRPPVGVIPPSCVDSS